MLSSRGGRLAILVLALGVRSARGGETGPALSTSDTCNVCRGVTQGFMDLRTEWSLVRNTEQSAVSNANNQGVADHLRQDARSIVTYEAAIERFCEQAFLSDNQQRVCYSISPFAAEVGKWLGMGVSPQRVCRKLGKRNPETCFDARQAERPSDSAKVLDWKSRPLSIPEDVDCSIDHRNSLSPRWVLLE